MRNGRREVSLQAGKTGCLPDQTQSATEQSQLSVSSRQPNSTMVKSVAADLSRAAQHVRRYLLSVHRAERLNVTLPVSPYADICLLTMTGEALERAQSRAVRADLRGGFVG